MLETIEIETAPNPTAAVIWLHGLGADGNDFAPIVPELGLGDAPAVRFVFPHAPMMPVTINNGYVMRAWYDVSYGDLEGRTKQADEKGVRASQAAIEQLIARENARGIADKNLVIAGFSQGGAIALHTGLRHAGRGGRAGQPCGADFLCARHPGCGDSDRPGRGLAAGADGRRPQRGVAHLRHAALGVRRGNPRYQRLAGARAALAGAATRAASP
jgi:alpha-beta hydrolase superfamily lysophospholipase